MIRLLATRKDDKYFKLKLYTLYPLWFVTRIKTFKEFYCGLITHQCEPDKSKRFFECHQDRIGGMFYYKCKHYGCGIIHPIN